MNDTLLTPVYQVLDVASRDLYYDPVLVKNAMLTMFALEKRLAVLTCALTEVLRDGEINSEISNLAQHALEGKDI